MRIALGMKLSAEKAEESCPAAVGGALSVERGAGDERMCGRAGSECQLAAGWRGRWVGAPSDELADEGRGARAPSASRCRLRMGPESRYGSVSSQGQRVSEECARGWRMRGRETRLGRADCRRCPAGRVASRARDAGRDGGWAGAQRRAVRCSRANMTSGRRAESTLQHAHLHP